MNNLGLNGRVDMGKGPYVPKCTIRTDPFSESYDVQGNIGRGRFAVVKKCVHKETDKIVAAKFIRKRRRGSSCREEILREIAMLELVLPHPCLVDFIEVFETQSEFILVTEYCAGGELFHEVVIEESFSESDVIRLLKQIIEGLVYLHDNSIMHLDLKPQNVLLSKPFPEGDVKLCDLGFASCVNTDEEMRDIIGTPDYVAPEVLGYEPLGLFTDIWSLGVLAYVMLTACSPFAGDTQQETYLNISQVNLDFPPTLFSHISLLAQDFIKLLLVKNPKKRLTAKQALEHPWLNNNVPMDVVNVEMANKSNEEDSSDQNTNGDFVTLNTNASSLTADINKDRSPSVSRKCVHRDFEKRSAENISEQNNEHMVLEHPNKDQIKIFNQNLFSSTTMLSDNGSTERVDVHHTLEATNDSDSIPEELPSKKPKYRDCSSDDEKLVDDKVQTIIHKNTKKYTSANGSNEMIVELKIVESISGNRREVLNNPKDIRFMSTLNIDDLKTSLTSLDNSNNGLASEAVVDLEGSVQNHSDV